MSNTACAQGCIFSPSVPGQVAELLAADRVQRPEDHDLAVLPPLQHGLQPGAQRQRRLAGAGPAAERDDADLGVEQQVERDPLLGADRPCSPNASRSPRTSRTCLSAVTRPSAEPRAEMQPQPGVAGQVGGSAGRCALEYSVPMSSSPTPPARPSRSSRSRPPARARYSSAGMPTDAPSPASACPWRPGPRPGPRRRGCGRPRGSGSRCRLSAEAGRQHGGVGVVELDVQRAAAVADRHRIVQPTVRDPQVVEHAERLPGEPAQLRMVPLALQLADHDERQDDLVLTEARQAPGSESSTLVSRTYVLRDSVVRRSATGPPWRRRTNARVSKVRHAHVGAGAGPLAVECSTRQGLPGGVPVRSASDPNGTTPGRRVPRTTPT